MPDYQLYVPSAEGYQVFLGNLKTHNPDWLEKEESLLREFSSSRENTDEEVVRKRAKALNASYGTRIPEVELNEIVDRILRPGVDEKLDCGSFELINELMRVPSKRTKSQTIDHFSFATKYCHHCRPDVYPIYDSVNARVLSVYFGYKDNRDYAEYVGYFKSFCGCIGCNYGKLKDGEGFYIDKYVQAIGRDRKLLA